MLTDFILKDYGNFTNKIHFSMMGLDQNILKHSTILTSNGGGKTTFASAIRDAVEIIKWDEVSETASNSTFEFGVRLNDRDYYYEIHTSDGQICFEELTGVEEKETVIFKSTENQIRLKEFNKELFDWFFNNLIVNDFDNVFSGVCMDKLEVMLGKLRLKNRANPSISLKNIIELCCIALKDDGKTYIIDDAYLGMSKDIAVALTNKLREGSSQFVALTSNAYTIDSIGDDEIWFIEDCESLYALTEFKGYKDFKDVEKAYYVGRFGATLGGYYV